MRINKKSTGTFNINSLMTLYLDGIKAVKAMDTRGRILFAVAAALLFGAILLSMAEYLDSKIIKEKSFVLPSDNLVIDSSMLAYASPEFEGMGSGLLYIPEGVIISTVKSFNYTVEEGDTLSEISKVYNIDVGTLISFNKIKDVRRIWAGTNLKIPDIDGLPYVVRRGDSLESIAAKHEVPLNNILDANDLESSVINPGEQLFIPGAKISEYEYKKATGTLFIYPASGRLSSPFGYRIDPFTGVRRMHYGIDIANRTGTTVKATMAGTVVVIAEQPLGYGKYIVVRHEQGFQSLYGHLDAILVRKGQRIIQGQKIGTMGSSGRSTGTHLHFSIYRNNIPVNPLNGYLYR